MKIRILDGVKDVNEFTPNVDGNTTKGLLVLSKRDDDRFPSEIGLRIRGLDVLEFLKKCIVGIGVVAETGAS